MIAKENDLIEKAKNGDEYSTTQLLEQYKVLVKKIARKFFLIGAEMDDLIQEGMIGLAHAISTFDQQKEVSFKSYASLVIKRSIITAVKKGSTYKNKMLSDSVSLDFKGGIKLESDEDLYFVIPSSLPLPDDEIIWLEKIKEIKKIIASSLSNYEKLVLSEYLKGKTYAQIAEQCKKNTSSVENALTRIRSKLQILKTM